MNQQEQEDGQSPTSVSAPPSASFQRHLVKVLLRDPANPGQAVIFNKSGTLREPAPVHRVAKRFYPGEKEVCFVATIKAEVGVLELHERAGKKDWW